MELIRSICGERAAIGLHAQHVYGSELLYNCRVWVLGWAASERLLLAGKTRRIQDHGSEPYWCASFCSFFKI